MKNVRELETYGAILIGCGIMAYTLMLASVDAPVWATIEFVMGTLFMVVGVWCVYLAGIGSVIYWTVEVERRVEYKENEWLPCDESGRIDDGYGNEPNATVAYLSSLEGSREERAFELAKNEYLAWLEHKADRYTTVYGYMGLGDRYEQHLL